MKKILLIASIFCIMVAFPVYAQQDPLSVVEVVESAHAVQINSMSTFPEIVWSPDGQAVALMDAKDNILYVVDTETGKDITSLSTPGIQALAFNSDGSLLAAATESGVIYVLNMDAFADFGPISNQSALAALEAGVFRNFARTDKNKWLSVTFSGDSSFLLATSLTGFRAWDIRDAGDFAPMIASGKGADAPFSPELAFSDTVSFWPNQLYPTPEGIRGLAFDGRNRTMKFTTVTLTANFKVGEVSISDTSAVLAEVKGGAVNVLGAYLSADTSTTLVLSTDTILLAGSKREPISFPYPDDTTNGFAVQISPDGSLLVVRVSDGTVGLVDIANGTQVYSGEAGQQPPSRLTNSIIYSPNNTKLLFIAGDKVEIWHLEGALAAPRDAALAASGAEAVACSVDLTDTIALLEQAQNTDDVDTFVKLMAEAREQLEGFEADCSGK